MLASRPCRIVGEIEALADARLGDPGAATLALAQADAAAPGIAFASAVERAESSLRRAEVLQGLGSAAEGRAAASAALVDLAGQQAGSPRLALAQALAKGLGA